MRRSPLLLLILAAAAACAHAPARSGAGQGERVEAEGWAALPERTGDPRARLESRRKALADAQRKAVEKVTGVTLSAFTRVKNAVAVDERIQAVANGAIESYEVLDERDEDGFLKIRIRALVLYDAAGLRRRACHAKVRVSIESPVLAAAVGKALEESGCSLAEADPDLIVTGLGRSVALAGIFDGFSSYRAQVRLSARAPDGGPAAHQRREASAIDPVAAIAAEKALENAGLLAAEALAEGF